MLTKKFPANIPGRTAAICQIFLKGFLISLATGSLFTGCATPANGKWFAENGKNAELREAMKRKDKIVHLSPAATAPDKPVLLLLHGATDDPTEMMDIVREWNCRYDVFLYAYNFHQPVERVAADFARELKRVESENPRAAWGTIVVYSYSAIVFRAAVIDTTDQSIFASVSLIQLVPTAGGSHLAAGLKNPFTAWLVSFVSKSSQAENPYGSLAKHLWDGDGNRKFYTTINPGRMHTIVLEGDAHSLAWTGDETVHERYENGIGTNVLVIPKSAGVTHDYFPTNPVALEYLRKLLKSPPQVATGNKI